LFHPAYDLVQLALRVGCAARNGAARLSYDLIAAALRLQITIGGGGSDGLFDAALDRFLCAFDSVLQRVHWMLPSG
jgi:hypothetical protein